MWSGKEGLAGSKNLKGRNEPCEYLHVSHCGMPMGPEVGACGLVEEEPGDPRAGASGREGTGGGEG